MKNYHIKKGYDIPLTGAAQMLLSQAPSSSKASVSIKDFHGVLPKLLVKIGDRVRAGTPLFAHKKMEELRFASPIAGKISHLEYAARRRLERIDIEVDAKSPKDALVYRRFRPDSISNCKRSELVDLLLSSGMWPMLRQRPYDVIADPKSQPDAIFVNCMDTAPLAAQAEFALKKHLSEFKAGIDALRVLAGNKEQAKSKGVHIVVHGGSIPSPFASIEGVSLASFTGKHPAGLVSTHIRHISPLNGSKLIWYLNAHQVVDLGIFLLTGCYPTERIICLAGTGIREDQRSYYKIQRGLSLAPLLKQSLLPNVEMRIISGNVLTGTQIQENDSLSFYDNLVTVIPEGRERILLGWMRPGLKRPTWSHSFASRFFRPRNTKYSMHTNQNGELRAFTKTGDYEKVMAVDVLPSFLIKAILAEDIELMEQLGIFEVAPEDFALCAYICPSKIEFCDIVRRGLDKMLVETAS